MKPGLYKYGFTLLELVVTILIVAILFSLALPSYRQYSLRSHRSEGLNALISSAMEMERRRLINRQYTEFLPRFTRSGYYEIGVQIIDNGDNYNLLATPLAGQKDDKCGWLGFNSQSMQTAEGDASSCWQGK